MQVFRVLWESGRKGLEFEDFNQETEAIRFARSLAATGTDCEISQVPPYGVPRWDV